MNRNKMRTVLSCLLLFVTQTIMAQQVTGVVEDENSGEKLSAVSLVINPGKYGTVTNDSGEFRFKEIPAGKYKLSVYMVGFFTQTKDIVVQKNKNTSLTIKLVQDNKRLDEVVVLGNYSQSRILENPVSEQASLIPALSNVSEVQIEKQGSVTLIDAMKYIPGGWTETRGRKVKQFFSIRGQKYPYPSYSVDGIWQKEFHEMPYFFNSSNIEEIQIVRSSSALLKGLNALSGVIDVKTKVPGKNEVDVFAKYGSLNTYYAGAAYGNSNESISYRASINTSGTKGPQDRNGKEEIYNAHGYFNWKLNDQLSWSANLFYLDGMRQLVQPVEPADNKFRNRKEVYDPIKNLLVSSKLKYKSKGKYSGELHLNYAHRNPKYKNENLLNGKITSYNETDWEFTINQINAFALSEHNTLRFGTLYNYWKAPEGKRFYYGKKAEVHTVSGVITDQHNFGRLLFDAGFRLTQEYFAEWGGFSIEGSGGKFSKVKAIIDEWQKPVWQATTGLTYSLPASSSLHFSLASGIVNPRKGALNEEGETPDNETRVNVDFGYVKNFENAGMFSVTTFLVNRKKAIEYTGTTIEIGENEIMELYQNKDKRNYGFEAEYKSPVFENCFSFFTNLTLMKGEIDNSGDWSEDNEMPNFIANLGANYQKNRFDFNAYMQYTGAYKNNRFVSKDYITEFGKAPLGDFLTFDTTLGYKLGKNEVARVFVEAKNIFNKEYQTVPGYPDYGRLISFGFQVNL